MTDLPVTRALISVSDKTGLVDFARFLVGQGVALLSTGGSARALIEAGLPVTEVSAHTGFPEIMDGRVKTLHPRIHGGLLARRDDAAHRAAMETHDIDPIDLLVSNLYPFEATLGAGADEATCIENIDVGGPAMIRAAAKNHDFVAVATSPADYALITAEMTAKKGALGLALRRKLAAAAFARTASYDAAIAGWMSRDEPLAPRLILAGERRQMLRYGENPHQRAAFYVTGERRPGVATARQLQGKELSYNNLNDTDAAYELVAEFDQPAVVIVKHANPCGAALGPDLDTAYGLALACDPVSAYGGIVAVNRPLDAATAEAIAELFAEVVIAPDSRAGGGRAAGGEEESAGAGGRIAAGSRRPGPQPEDARRRLPRPEPRQRPPQEIGSEGRDQARAHRRRDRRHALRLRRRQACEIQRHRLCQGRGHGGHRRRADEPGRFLPHRRLESQGSGRGRGAAESPTKGSVVASDAFFPFADGLLAAVEAGATAVIQPGGSLRDPEVIAAADAAGIAMVFTGHAPFPALRAALHCNSHAFLPFVIPAKAGSRATSEPCGPGFPLSRE